MDTFAVKKDDAWIISHALRVLVQNINNCLARNEVPDIIVDGESPTARIKELQRFFDGQIPVVVTTGAKTGREMARESGTEGT